MNAIVCPKSLPNLMTKTLLFDLDDTLIGNPMDLFVPEYSRALAKRLAPERQGELIRELFKATALMMQNLRADCTLEQVFDQYFFPALNITRREIQPFIDSFYLKDFPKLVNVTQHRTEATQIVTEAIERGWQIAIATNPLFPLTAIQQRLTWAGLDGDEYPWIIIPSYETFHFTKPNPEYFAELLGQIGWPEDPVIMVGNDKEMDIDAAKDFGLATYWVNPIGENPKAPAYTRNAQGKLGDLFSWLGSQNLDELKFENKSNRSLLAVLRSTIAALTTLTRNLTLVDWTRKSTATEWCITEIICHLRDVEEEVNLPRVESVLSQNNPFITGKNTDVWVEERNYTEQDGLNALEIFVNSRMKLIHILENLADQAWSLTARHSIFGPIQLSELINITSSHDKLHLNSIHQLANNKQYDRY